MKNEINKNKDITANSEQLAALKAQFPSCFDKDGRFRPDKLEDIVRASGADITREGYKLDWLGKSYARLLANLKTETLLAPNEAHNALPENAKSENLLIQGDNLDVLKHLVNAYSEKVKMIYIDPPYNTGSDGFVYNDTRKFTPDELQRLAGVDEDEAKRILDFTQSASNSHSAWLTFMYPRLYVARELLREDGVIFISIDGNEQAQLKLLCDEVFGEENEIGSIAVVSNRKGRSDDKYFATAHNSLIVYKKNTFDNLGVPLSDEYLADYTEIDSAGRKYRLQGLRKRGDSALRQDRPNMFYPVFATLHDSSVSLTRSDRHDIEVLPRLSNGTEGRWRWGPVTAKDRISELKSKPVGKDGRLDIFQIDYADGFNGEKRTKPKTVWEGSQFSNEAGSLEVKALFDSKIFETPKPIGLLTHCLQQGAGVADLVLDFFSGSGTTAHAVMALNAQDGGNRRHISVQLDEPTDPKSEAHKTGYATIFDITRERIIRAAAKIKADHPDVTCDFGFKEFKTIPANEGPFKGYLDDAATRDEFVPFNGMALDDDAITALLTTWKAYDGLPLHLDLTPVDLGGYIAYQGGDKIYFVNRGLDTSHIVALLTRIDDDATFTPRKIVVFHYRFNDIQLRELAEAVNAPNRKHLQLDFIQRF